MGSLHNFGSEPTNVLRLIHQQNEILKQYIEFIKDESTETSKKQTLLSDFIDIFTAHIKSEEVTLYHVLQQTEDARWMAFEAVEDHAIARILIQELEDMKFRKRWNDDIECKARILAAVVGHQLQQEESQFFKGVSEVLTIEELSLLGKQFQGCLNSFKPEEKIPSGPVFLN